MTATSAEAVTFDPEALGRLLDGRYAEIRNELRGVMCRPEFAPVVAIETCEYRERVLTWARALGLREP